MSLDTSLDAKQRVKDATDIVDLVGSYVQLRRDGRAYKALCPWHDDTRPSLQVNPERQSFKCWVCDIGGDVFSFIMKMEGVPFPEALTMLADKAGIQLGRSRETGGLPGDKRALLEAMAWAVEQYHQFLICDAEASAARQYLAERSISQETVKKFQLGLAPQAWDWLSQRAAPTAIKVQLLEKVGLVSRRPSGGGYYDRFRGRVLFPIFDTQQRAVGLGGRILPGAEGGAKYINSPHTPLFSKSNLLYGLDVSREAIRKSGTALVMEGYTDVLLAHQFGITNSVAVLGTALGPQQVQLLRRCADRLRIVLVLDGDEAGRKRASEILELFISQNVDLRVLTLPDELDPCEFLLANGADAFGALVERSPDALAHAVQTTTGGVDIQRDVHAASEALEQLVATIAKAPRLRSDTTRDDRLREEKFLERLAFDFRVPEEKLRARMSELRRKGGNRREPASAPSSAAQLDPCDQELVELLLLRPEACMALLADIPPEMLAGEPCRTVLVKSSELAAGGVIPTFERLLLEIDDPLVKTLLVKLDDEGRAKGVGDFDQRLNDVLARLRHRSQEPLWRAHTSALRERKLAAEDELAILHQLQQQERIRQGISVPTDG